MKAALYTAPGEIIVRDIPTPVPDDDSVLLRVRACAVCGSDIRIFRHGNSRVTPPQTLGHEIAGEVVQIGSRVTKLKLGDRVAVGADVPCGECAFCEAGIGNNCQVNHAMGYQFAGGFAEYLLLNRMVMTYGPVHILPEHVSWAEGALAEPLACVLNALELTPVRLNDMVLVLGAGPIGMMLCEVARAMGAGRVMLVNRSRARLDTARALGVADVYVCSGDEDVAAAVRRETGGLGADVILTANPSPQSQADSLQLAKNRARINFFGGLPAGSLVTLDTNIIHYKELMVTGAHGSLPIHHARAVDMIASGRIDMKKFASHRFPLEQITEAFAAAESHAGLRVIVTDA